MAIQLSSNRERVSRDRAAKMRQITALVREGVSWVSACILAGTTPQTANHWLQSAELGRRQDGGGVSPAALAQMQEFAHDVQRAAGLREREALRRLRKSAMSRDKLGRYDWRADVWLLEHSPWFRGQYGYKLQVVHRSGRVDTETEQLRAGVQELTIEAVEAQFQERRARAQALEP